MIVLITGQCRSGTSAVAQMVHTLGVPVAVEMHAPLPPSYRADWEDIRLSLELAPLSLGRGPAPRADWFLDHFAYRQDMARRLWGAPSFASKSPMLALVWPDALGAAAAFGPVVTIKTSRDPKAVAVSLARSVARGMPELASTNELIGAALAGIATDLTVPYEALTDEPAYWANLVAGRIGITSPERIEAATAAVLEPTSWV